MCVRVCVWFNAGHESCNILNWYGIEIIIFVWFKIHMSFCCCQKKKKKNCVYIIGDIIGIDEILWCLIIYVNGPLLSSVFFSTPYDLCIAWHLPILFIPLWLMIMQSNSQCEMIKWRHSSERANEQKNNWMKFVLSSFIVNGIMF